MPIRVWATMVVLLAGCAEPEVLRRAPSEPEMMPPPAGGAPLPAIARPTGGRIELPPPAAQ